MAGLDSPTLVFVSNFVSPHTIPLCEELFKELGHSFMFIETLELTNERQSLGYNTLQNKPFVISFSKYIKDTNYYHTVINSAECVLASLGSIDITLLTDRINNNSLTILLSERLFKNGILKILDPKLWRTIHFIKLIHDKKFALLCLGSYVAKDFSLCGFNKNSMWKFGYLTPIHSFIPGQKEESNSIKLLWVGRLIWWKRPLIAVKAFEILRAEGFNVSLNIIGDGYLRRYLIHRIKSSSYYSSISFHGIMKRSDVDLYMQHSDILLCTSNRKEGWGAIINEGLSNRCVVVANVKMGGAGFLIKDGETGFLYKGGARNLANKIKHVILTGSISTIPHNGWSYLCRCWSPSVASDRLLQLISSLKNNTPEPPQIDGVCDKIL